MIGNGWLQEYSLAAGVRGNEVCLGQGLYGGKRVLK